MFYLIRILNTKYKHGCSIHARGSREKRLGRGTHYNKFSNSSLLPTSSQRAALAMSGQTTPRVSVQSNE